MNTDSKMITACGKSIEATTKPKTPMLVMKCDEVSKLMI